MKVKWQLNIRIRNNNWTGNEDKYKITIKLNIKLTIK